LLTKSLVCDTDRLALDSVPLHTKWYHPIANAYTYLKSIIVGAKPTKQIIDFIEDKTTIIENKEMVFGVYTLINAKTPKRNNLA